MSERKIAKTVYFTEGELTRIEEAHKELCSVAGDRSESAFVRELVLGALQPRGPAPVAPAPAHAPVKLAPADRAEIHNLALSLGEAQETMRRQLLFAVAELRDLLPPRQRVEAPINPEAPRPEDLPRELEREPRRPAIAARGWIHDRDVGFEIPVGSAGARHLTMRHPADPQRVEAPTDPLAFGAPLVITRSPRLDPIARAEISAPSPTNGSQIDPLAAAIVGARPDVPPEDAARVTEHARRRGRPPNALRERQIRDIAAAHGVELVSVDVSRREFVVAEGAESKDVDELLAALRTIGWRATTPPPAPRDPSAPSTGDAEIQDPARPA